MGNKTSWYTNTKEDYEKLADIQKCVDELYEKIGGFESEKLACMHMTAEYSDWEKANKLFKEIKKIKEGLNNEKYTEACKAEDQTLAAIIATPGHKTLVKTWEDEAAEWKDRQAAWETHVKEVKPLYGTPERKAKDEAEEELNNEK